MSRTRLLAMIVIATNPVVTSAYTPVSLNPVNGTAPAMRSPDFARVAPAGPGLPITWEVLREKDRAAPGSGICKVIGDHHRKSGSEPGVDPALILEQLRARGLCRGDG